MKITTHIRNIIFLWRMNGVNSKRNKTEISKNADAEGILRFTKNTYKRKNSWVRNQVALLIRKIRKEKPYKIKDYSKAKELYDSREPIDLLKVKPGDYVYKISREEPVKGKRWCEYYINESGTEGIYKVHKWNDSYNYWSVEDYTGDTNTYGNTLDEESSRSFRFATKEEIEQFKIARKNYKQKKKEIEVLQKQINKLYRKL